MYSVYPLVYKVWFYKHDYTRDRCSFDCWATFQNSDCLIFITLFETEYIIFTFFKLSLNNVKITIS